MMTKRRSLYAHHPECHGVTKRQDLCQSAQGRCHPGADLQAAAAASRRRALSDPPLRLSGDRRERSRRCQALCQDRASRAARSTHAVAHLHARRLLAELIASNSASARLRRKARISASSCTPWTIWSMPICSWRRTARPRRHRRNDRDHGLQPAVARSLRAGRQPGALCGRARRLEGRGRAEGPAEPVCLCRCDHLFRTRPWAPRARAIQTQQRRTSPSWRSCATSCSRPRTPIGPRKSTFSGRSPRLAALCRGQTGGSVGSDGAAADAEDKTEKSVVTPGPPNAGTRALRDYAARSGHGDGGARRVRSTMRKEPNRLGATVGAANAAEKAGTPRRPASTTRKSSRSPKMPIRSAGDRGSARIHVGALRAREGWQLR